MLQNTLFTRFTCRKCQQPARVHKFYRLCINCMRDCRQHPQLAANWFYVGHDPKPTTLKPGSEEKLRLMRRRLLRGESLCSPQDTQLIDWELTKLAELYSEPQQRTAGKTGVERDGNRYRARPMAGGVKHNLGEFHTEAEAANVVEWFWIGWLGLGPTEGLIVVDPTRALPPKVAQEEIDTAREADATNARDMARERRKEELFQRAAEEVTPLFGAALQYA